MALIQQRQHPNMHFMTMHVQHRPTHCAEAAMSRLPDLVTVPSLDLNRYLGTWYEIARLPIRFEDADCTDVSAHYALQDDGTVRVQNRCLTAEGELKRPSVRPAPSTTATRAWKSPSCPKACAGFLSPKAITG